jgi:hypothetical protein
MITPEQAQNDMLAYTRAEHARALKKAVALAMQHEREACANIARSRAIGLGLLCPDTDETRSRIAEAQVIERDIRARTR